MRGMQARVGLGVTVLFGAGIALAGCVGVSAKHTQICCERHLVAVNGLVYLVNSSDGKVMRIDLDTAQPFTKADTHCHDHDDHDDHDDDD